MKAWLDCDGRLAVEVRSRPGAHLNEPAGEAGGLVLAFGFCRRTIVGGPAFDAGFCPSTALWNDLAGLISVKGLQNPVRGIL